MVRGRLSCFQGVGDGIDPPTEARFQGVGRESEPNADADRQRFPGRYIALRVVT